VSDRVPGPVPATESEPEAFMWDWREQPPMDRIAAAIQRLSAGRLRMYLPETGMDSYVAIISDRDLDADEQEATWLER
jgi:hypothetical protein